MKIGDEVRVRRGPLIGYGGKVTRVLAEGNPPRARVAFEMPRESHENWFPIEDLAARHGDA